MRLILTGKTFDDIKKQMATFFETTPKRPSVEPMPEPIVEKLYQEPKEQPKAEPAKPVGKRGRPKGSTKPKVADAMTDFDNEEPGDMDESVMAPSPSELPDLKSEIDMAKMRASMIEPAQDDEEETSEEPTPEVKSAIDKSQVIEHLKNVNDRKGLAIAKKLLSDFSCNRVSDLPEAKYESFVKVCKELLAN